MKKCFIHIGVHKTGTTAIQILLGKHREALLAKGIYVPHAANPWDQKVGYHHNLAFEVNGDPRFVPKYGGIERLVQELSAESPSTVVISSEDLCVATKDPEKVSRLREPLKDLGYEIEWIVYFRTFPDWAESAYIEMAKAMAVTDRFEGWARKSDHILQTGFNPLCLIDPIKATGDTITVHSYAMACPDVTGHFFSHIGAHGILTGEAVVKDPVNSRITLFEVEFLRNMTVFSVRHVPMGNRGIFAKAVREIQKSLPDGPAYRGLTEQFAEQLYEKARKPCEEMLSEFRPDCLMDEFFPRMKSYDPATIDTAQTDVQSRLRLYQAISDMVYSREFTDLPET